MTQPNFPIDDDAMLELLIKEHNKHCVPKTETTASSSEEIDDNIELIDMFIKKYNQLHRKNDHLFSNINEKDPTGTNDQMELFYEYMKEYQELYAENPENVDIYDTSTFNNNNNRNIYAMVNSDDMSILCISLSYISLLKYGANTDLKDSDKWNIVKM